jgi:hypothetical protein
MWNSFKQDLNIHFKPARQHSVSVYESKCLSFWQSNKPHKCMSSMQHILHENLTFTQPVKFPTFYRTGMCIIMFKQALQLVNIFSHMNPDQTFTPTSPRSISNYLSIYSGFTCCLFLTFKYSNQKWMWTSPLTHIGYTPNPFHPLWFNHNSNISRRLQTMAFLIKKYSPGYCYAKWLIMWLYFY